MKARPFSRLGLYAVICSLMIAGSAHARQPPPEVRTLWDLQKACKLILDESKRELSGSLEGLDSWDHIGEKLPYLMFTCCHEWWEPGMVAVDMWGQPIRVISVDGKLHSLGSAGENMRWEYGLGDDITVDIHGQWEFMTPRPPAPLWRMVFAVVVTTLTGILAFAAGFKIARRDDSDYTAP